MLEIPYCEYRQNRDGSITNKVSAKSFWDLSLFVGDFTKKMTTRRKANSVIERYAMSNIAYEYSIMCWQVSKLDKEERKKAIRFLRKYKWTLKFGESKKTKLIRLMCGILGIYISSQILNLYMEMR